MDLNALMSIGRMSLPILSSPHILFLIIFLILLLFLSPICLTQEAMEILENNAAMKRLEEAKGLEEQKPLVQLSHNGVRLMLQWCYCGVTMRPCID
jgi:hypothetical protein